MSISRLWRADFKTNSQVDNNSGYDIIDDYDLIESSFFQQYGLRLRSANLEWDEFLNLLSGLLPETPLGRIVSIRLEKNPDVLKEFTPEQKKIRSDWQRKNVVKLNYGEAMANFDAMFRALM